MAERKELSSIEYGLVQIIIIMVIYDLCIYTCSRVDYGTVSILSSNFGLEVG